MNERPFDIILIGGSAGSLDIIIRVLASLPPGFDIPIVLIIHRLKNTDSHLDDLLSRKMDDHIVIEPEDKQAIRKGMIYLAPQNYHLLAEADHSFVLDYSEPVHYSRPSIDVSFESFAEVYRDKLMAILLSGANKDGAMGLQAVLAKGGKAVIQSPASATSTVMPETAIEQNKNASVFTPEQIIHCILKTKS